MSDSILTSIKKACGLGEDDESFDADILMHINSTFSSINLVGIGPDDGFMIEDKTTTWDAFLGSDSRLNMVKSYMYLQVRYLFDPPTTSYLQSAYDKQILKYEWLLSTQRELTSWVDPNTGVGIPDVEDLVVDGGLP